MEGPHDEEIAAAAEQNGVSITAVDHPSQHSNNTSQDLGQLMDATVNLTSPIFVQGDDGSLIYRSFRVREAKVCETVTFPLAAVPSAVSPQSCSNRFSAGDATSDENMGGGINDSSKLPPSESQSSQINQPMPYIFCEMQELAYNAGRHNFEWRETTRWMFFEESVERPGDRWSKPHVPSLPAASVFDFRNCLISGTIVLNLDASSFEELADMVGDILIATNQLSPGAKPEFLSILHLRHLHHFEYKHSTVGSLKRLAKTTRVNLTAGVSQKDGDTTGPVTVDLDNDPADERHQAIVSSNPDRVHKVNPLYRRYVPYNAQAASILVGEVAALRSQMTIFVRLARPLYVGDLTEIDAPLKFVCIILGPPPQQRLNTSSVSTSALMVDTFSLTTMGRVFGALLSNPAFSRIALRAENREGLMAAFDAVVDRSTLLPAETWDPDVRLAPIAFPSQSKHSSAQLQANRQTMRILPTAEADLDSSLTRTGFLFGGLIRDIQRKMPHFVSDFSDCLHFECGLASVVMLLTTLTWLLVFSAMYEAMTEQQIGAAETFLGACLAGLVFYLAAGQPLTVVGTTASLFAFERALFAFCKAYDLNYVGFHFWVIFWTLVVLFIVVMFDLSAIVCYFTRFSQEIFSVFVASVLMYEALASLVRIRQQFPLDDAQCVCVRDPELFVDETSCRVRSVTTCHTLIGCKVAGNCARPNSFIFSCLLFVLTYLIVATFKSFRSSFLLPNRARVIVGNFALPLTVVILTIFASCVNVEVPRLHFSPLRSDGRFATTDPERGLLVDPGVVPAWGVFVAILVALPCALLVVMDQHFAAIIVNRRENRLRHGCGYHLDLAVIAVALIFSAVFGLPMFVGVVILSYANVVSLQHTPSMSKESKVGYAPLSFRIREQRVSSIVVSVLIGFCILLRGIFAYIPVAVLYGIFFYIGLAMLTGTQMWHRVRLMFIPVKYQPDFKFLRYIELVKVHVFTIFQVVLFLLLWLIAIIKPVAFAFPLILIIIALARRLLAFGFSRDELLRLDALLLPLSVICRPSDYVDPGTSCDEPAKPLSSSSAGEKRRHAHEIVQSMRKGLVKKLGSAREAIRRQFVERSPLRRQRDGDEEVGERSALSAGDESSKPRDLGDEVDEVRTASVMGSPISNSSSVYDSATAAIQQPSSCSNRPPSASGGAAYLTASPPTNSKTARLLTKQLGADDDLNSDVSGAAAAKTRIKVVNVSDTDYDADGDETMPTDARKKTLAANEATPQQ